MSDFRARSPWLGGSEPPQLLTVPQAVALPEQAGFTLWKGNLNWAGEPSFAIDESDVFGLESEDSEVDAPSPYRAKAIRKTAQ